MKVILFKTLTAQYTMVGGSTGSTNNRGGKHSHVVDDDYEGHVQERDIITFVTNFSCWRAWNREILIKNGSRWTQNWKNGTSPKIMIFFIFCLYINEKWKNHDFLACPSSFLIKNHWKIMIFGFCVFEKRKNCNFRLIFV